MQFTFKAMPGKVIVKAVKEQEVERGGLVIKADKAGQRTSKCEVVSFNPIVSPMATELTTEIEVGTIVVIPKYALMDLDLGEFIDEKYYSCNIGDIACVLVEAPQA